MRTFLHDLKFGFRLLIKSRVFTAVAVLTLALGIGVNTAIFSVIDAVLLRALPYQDPDAVVQVFDNFPGLKLEKVWVSPLEYQDYTKQAATFQQTAVYDTWDVNLTGESEPERVQGVVATASLFPLLGVQPALGRVFTPEEDAPGANRVVVISHGFWQRRFGSDPNVLNKTLIFDEEGYSIVGVMPAGFHFPNKEVEVWSPIAFDPVMFTEDERPSRYVNMLARLKPGVTLEQARAEMSIVAARLQQQHPEAYAANSGYGVVTSSLHEETVGDVRRPLLLLLGAVGFVLLIGCANVANLLLTRAVARRKETAIRTALGASRGRLVRQLLTESLALALIGGALGLLLAYWGISLMGSLSPEYNVYLRDVTVDARAFGFTLGVALLTGFVFGIIPALQSSQTDLSEAFKEGSGKGSAGGRSQRTRNLLTVAEIATSLVLLIGAGLMIKSFARLQRVEAGFNPENVLTMQLSLPATKYKEPPQRAAFYEQALQQAAALPGVQAAGAISQLPLASEGSDRSFMIEDRPSQTPPPGAEFRVVSPDYFRAMGVPMLKGRAFGAQDREGVPRVVIINQALARRYWPDEDPLGKRISYDGPADRRNWREIVGVVGDVRQLGLSAEAKPEMYVPFLQQPRGSMTMVLRTAADPGRAATAARAAVRAVDTNQSVYNVRTMKQVMSESIARQRLFMILLAAFAAVALLLAAVGIYGVIAYSVAQRTHEIGIRLALGAQPRNVLGLVIRQGMLLTLLGIAAGLFLAFALTRLMSSVLYGVSFTDPAVYLSLPLVLALVALLACYVPARRATKVDPAVALRYE